ncbi:hypothetical protein LNKW23_19030 [Paralimibaculum aggregatum]|uniref:Uncharacterized protein n=1 Tax=Paralimibaculum aggregatum TaxID=3036245 RepID=A0ABQ6LQB0_9RHOB|nr:hypothetical protein LNKW23_19030 [Limibaculum sp. NKW23]
MPDTDPAKPAPPTGNQPDWTASVLAELGLGPPTNPPTNAPHGNTGAPVTASENARLAALSAEELAATNLTMGDTKALFGQSYMLRLKDTPIRGEGDPALKALMREVEKGLSGPRRTAVMQDLAGIVGIPPTAEQLDLDYGRFLVVRRQQAAIGTAKNDTVPGLNEEMHPRFMASRPQLMFGKVVGDAFGIHEVFAALLSPTGGLVGPGNWLIPGVVKAGHLAPDNPVGLHGTVHDAAGYLLSFHDAGPGYNYRDSRIEILGTDSPLSGQVSGIAFWAKEAGDDYVRHRVDAALVEMEKALKSARDAVTAEIERRLAEAQQAAARAAGTAKGLAEKAGQVMVGVGDAILDARDKVRRTAVQTFETATRALGGKPNRKAKDKLDAAWDFIWS